MPRFDKDPGTYRGLPALRAVREPFQAVDGGVPAQHPGAGVQQVDAVEQGLQLGGPCTGGDVNSMMSRGGFGAKIRG